MNLIKKPSELQLKKTVSALVYGQPGTGKAQPLTAPVLTPSGYIPMGEIHVGSLVMGSDGKCQTVENVFPQGKRPVYAVVLSDGAVAHCDIEHLWTVRNSSGNSRKAGWRVKTLKEMLEMGILCPNSHSREASGRKPTPRFEIPVCSPIEYDEKNLPVQPYLLGVLIGDGSMTSSVVGFSNPDFDCYISSKVLRMLPSEYALNRYYYENTTCPQYKIVKADNEAPSFVSVIKSLGLNVHSGQKFIPKEYFTGCVEQRLELLRGLMDTDGTCSNNRTSFSTSSPQLADDVVCLVRSLGGTATVKCYERSDKNSVEYQVRIRMSVCPFSLPRKANEWNPVNVSRYIVSATYVGEEECQCIMVSNNDELYITSDYIVTHNSTLACSAPDAVLFDFDGGVSRINGAHQVPTVQVDSWEMAVEAMQQVKADDSFKTIVIDTAGKMISYMEDYIKRTDPKKRKADGSLSLQGYGVRKQMFLNFINEVFISGKNIVFVAHEIEQKRGDESIIRPEVGGSSANDLIKELDLVGYMEMYGKKRTISFFPCDKFYAKNACNLPEVIEIPVLTDDKGNPVAKNDFLARIINVYTKSLQESAEKTKAFDALIEEISAKIAEIETAKDANDFMSWVMNDVEHIYNSKAIAADKLSKRAKSLNLEYNKSTKTYQDAA